MDRGARARRRHPPHVPARQHLHRTCPPRWPALTASSAVLLGEGHDGRFYDVTGPEAITLQEVAEELSRFAGRDVVYYPETLEEVYASRASYGEPERKVEGWVASYAAIATGELDVVSDTVRELTGHAPMNLAEFLGLHPESYRHLLAAR